MSLSISAGLSPQSFPPLSRLQNELTSEVASGAIGSGDQPTLSSALNDIDTALKSQAPSPSSPPSPGAIKAKIDDLIAGEVKDGKLTSAQADELKTSSPRPFKAARVAPAGRMVLEVRAVPVVHMVLEVRAAAGPAAPRPTTPTLPIRMVTALSPLRSGRPMTTRIRFKPTPKPTPA